MRDPGAMQCRYMVLPTQRAVIGLVVAGRRCAGGLQPVRSAETRRAGRLSQRTEACQGVPALPEGREGMQGNDGGALPKARRTGRWFRIRPRGRGGESALCGSATPRPRSGWLPGTIAPSEIFMIRVGSSSPRFGSIRRREKQRARPVRRVRPTIAASAVSMPIS